MSVRTRVPALAFALALLVAGALSWPAPTGEKPKKFKADPTGMPKGFSAGDTFRYAVWYGKGTWHLRCTTAGREHRFKGEVRVEGGTIEGVRSVHLDKKKGKFEDRWRLGAKRRVLEFDFKTDLNIDGIDFELSNSADRVSFHLHIDGKHEPDRIFVGRDGRHPPAAAFSFPARP